MIMPAAVGPTGQCHRPVSIRCCRRHTLWSLICRPVRSAGRRRQHVMQRIALDHKRAKVWRGGRLPVVLTLTVSVERKITAVDVVAGCDRPRRPHLAVLRGQARR